MQATSSTLFVRVNTGVTENAGMEMRDSRKVTLENPKPTRITELGVVLMLASKNEVHVTTRNGVMAHFTLIHYMPV